MTIKIKKIMSTYSFYVTLIFINIITLAVLIGGVLRWSVNTPTVRFIQIVCALSLVIFSYCFYRYHTFLKDALKTRRAALEQYAVANNAQFYDNPTDIVQRSVNIPDAVNMHRYAEFGQNPLTGTPEPAQYMNTIQGDGWLYYDLWLKNFNINIGGDTFHYQSVFDISCSTPLPHMYLQSKRQMLRKRGPFFIYSNIVKGLKVGYRVYALPKDHDTVRNLINGGVADLLKHPLGCDIEVVNGHILLIGPLDTKPTAYLTKVHLAASQIKSVLENGASGAAIAPTQTQTKRLRRSKFRALRDYAMDNFIITFCVVVLFLIFVPWLISVAISALG